MALKMLTIPMHPVFMDALDKYVDDNCLSRTAFIRKLIVKHFIDNGLQDKYPSIVANENSLKRVGKARKREV